MVYKWSSLVQFGVRRAPLIRFVLKIISYSEAVQLGIDNIFEVVYEADKIENTICIICVLVNDRILDIQFVL